jgi:hypothetical protein
MTLKQEFQNNPGQFCDDYAITLPGTAMEGGTIVVYGAVLNERTRRNELRPIDGTFYTVDVEGRQVHKGYDYNPVATRVAWYTSAPGEVRLLIENSKVHQEGLAQGGVMVPFNIPGNEWFDAYFLPWNKGYVARMHLPSGGPTNYFFTAEMNGCAFMATGRRASPYVAHLNVEEPEVGRPGNWETARQNVLETQITEALVGANGRDTRVMTKWGGKIVGGGGNARTLIDNGPSYDATQQEIIAAVGEFNAGLLLQNRKIDPNAPTGAVADIRVSTMGVQVNNEWKFYYQRTLFVKANMTIEKLNSKWKGFKKAVFGDHRPREMRESRHIIPGSERVHFWKL